MKLNKDAPLFDFNGTALTIAEDKPLTLGWLCLEVLQMVFKGEDGPGGDEKMKRFNLALRISRNKAPNLTTDEVSKIKVLIDKVPLWGPLIVGQAWELLEGKPGMVGPATEDEKPEEPVEALDIPTAKAHLERLKRRPS